MKTRTIAGKPALQIIALFCIYLMMNITVVHALTITHNPGSDVKATSTQAEIRWTTDNASDSTIEYGQDKGLGSSESESDPVTDHLITLTGLGAAETYYYKLTSSTAGETATADNSGSLYSFTTRASTDTAPPQFNVSLPEYYNRRQITFGGYTDPDSIIRLYVNPSSPADIGTDRYTQLTTSDGSGHFIFKYVNLQTDNSIVIWAKDPAGNTNSETYNINVDTDPPVVKLSNLPSLAASTSLAINGTVSENVTLTYIVNNDSKTKGLAPGKFDLQLNLKEGVKNGIDLQFADKAGNVVEKEFNVNIDTQGPAITWHNLNALDPSYIQEVEVEGNVSKPGATVLIFVNNRTYSSQSWSTGIRDMIVHYGQLIGEGDYEYSAKTDANGHFKIKVYLTQEIASKKAEYQRDVYRTSPTVNKSAPGGGIVTYGTAEGVVGGTTPSTGKFSNAWDNRIIIVVFDELGRSAKADGIVTFARCGYGADWNIEVTKPTPSVIIPDHLRMGMAQIAFAVKLEWQGPGDTGKMLRDPVVKQYKLSEEMKKDYVFDPNQLVSRVNPKWSTDRKTGYVVIELHKKDYEQKNLSKLKKEDLFIKLPMQVELEYQYQDAGQMVTAIQKQCWDITTVLDVKIPPSVIPKELLNASVIFLNKTIKAIDQLLKPLKTITIAVFVTCLLSWVVYFISLMKKAYACMDQKKGEESNECLEATENSKKVEKYMHFVCDRIFCPVVPLADVYFQEQSETKGCKGGLTPEMSKDDNACGEEYMDQWDSGCLLMNELERSKCIRYELTKDERFQKFCGEAASLKNIWYAISDFCEKKDTQGTRKVAVEKQVDGKKITEEYIVDDKGQVRKVSSKVTVEEAKKQGKDIYTKTSGGKKEEYVTEPLLRYSKDGKDYDEKITYDEAGRLYYMDGSEKHYLCESRKKAAADGTKEKLDLGSSTGRNTDCEGDGPMTLPNDLMKQLNLPGTRKHVVKPTDNLKVALQCVCLPAISGFLTLWRNIFGAVMQCFQSILITGEGSTGLCRAVLTTYICDLVFDAIRCFVRRYGFGTEARTKPQSGISAFFKSAATAGQDIQKSITGRYGKSALYKTMFSERKLIHAVCLWAFTGDFDFDIGSALTGPGAIPLKSVAFLYPRTRRFMSSNPLTGYATHIYHIGAGLVAGADMDYKLQLVCSNSADCDIQEGFPSGHCDCYSLGREIVRDITRSFGPGRLIAGQMLGPNEGDIYVKLDSDKYRYDKVRLTYRYKNNEGKFETVVEEGKIRQIGGSPPADCKFDLAAGAFRCEFEIGDMGYAIFTEAPKPKKSIYRIGELMELDFKVDKRSPAKKTGTEAIYSVEQSYDQIPFYIRYTVTSPTGAVIQKPQVIPIVSDGIFGPPVSIPGIPITEEIIIGGGIVTDYVAERHLGSIRPISPSKIDSSIKTRGTTPDFAVYLKKDGGKYTVQVCEGSFRQEIQAGRPIDVYYHSDEQSPAADICKSPITESDTSLKLEDRETAERRVIVEYNGIKIYVPTDQISERWGGFIMRYKPPTTATTAGFTKCQTTYNSANPAVFNVKIGLYPCQKVRKDEPVSLSNCVPSATPVDYYGAVQEHNVKVQAICTSSGAEIAGICKMNARTVEPCDCSLTPTGKMDCGKDSSQNYCFFAVREAECTKYTPCTKDILINTDNYATRVSIGDTTHYYCDCDGDNRMEDCSGKYCYEKGGKWDCYPNPP